MRFPSEVEMTLLFCITHICHMTKEYYHHGFT
jgi:hypothetical protein